VTDQRGRVESINTSRGGVPKTSVFEALITEHGVDGDRQRDPRFHGGPDRAVVLFSLEVIRALQQEGHPIAPGGTGENLTVSGVDWTTVVPGAELAIGGVRLFVTKYASPCEKIAHCLLNEDITRMSQKRHPGWSRVCARVVEGGIVRVGDVVVVSLADAGRSASAP
jgi:MOSC domain-containing protein YiiM